MLRLLLLITFFYALSGAESFKEDDNLEIIAKNIVMEDEIVTATGNVIVYSPTKYMTAEKLIYNRDKSTLELFDNVVIVQDGQITNYSEYLFLDTKRDLKLSKPSFILEGSGELWFNSKEIDVNKSSYEFKNTILSSCDCVDPAWNLSASSGDYDSEEKWLNTYNTRLYVKGVPVLYTPYFGFSTDKTRRTGLLPPTVGYSGGEGLLYAQPLYYAPTVDFDLEFIPQIRHSRGYGYETKLRYADSPVSLLTGSFGAFYEKDSYYKEEKLKNKKHSGWNLQYDRSKLFSSEEHTDGLKIDIADMNDVDYQSVKHDNEIDNLTDKTLTSEIKYYYNTNNYYGGIKFEKFKDLSQDKSNDILQTLPKVNLHKYSDGFLIDGLTYSTDLTYDRQTRDSSLSADTTSLTIPITYTNSLIDDYLEFSLGEELNFTQIDYRNNKSSYKDGKFATLTHFAKVQTNLLRPYEDYIHTINLSATYKNPESIQKKGDLYSINSSNSDLSDFPITEPNETILLSLNTSFYEKETLSQVINYKISQLYTYNKDTNNYEENDLAQNIRLHFGDFILSNDLSYSHDLKKIVLSTTTLDYQYKQAYVNIYYKFEKDKTTLDNQEDLVYTIGYKFDDIYSLSYREEIDLTSDIKKTKEYIFGIDKKCWALNLKYADAVVATNTIDNSVQRQKVIYVELNLKELFMFDQNFKRD